MRNIHPVNEREDAIYDKGFRHGIAVAAQAVKTNYDRPISEILAQISEHEQEWLRHFLGES